MPIHGQYNSQLQNISIDLPAHLFSKDEAVVFHEVTHYFLSNYTNEGAVFSILSENCLSPRKLVIEKNKAEKALSLLHEDMYQAQEGFAHLMQAMQIYNEKGGMQSVKDWEDRLPSPSKIAFSFVRYALGLSREQKENFTTKLSDISLNTDIYARVIKDPNFLICDDLEIYLKDENNSSRKRFEKVTRSIEKDPSLLNLSIENICKKIGLTYHPILSNKDKAALINAITIFTDSPTSVRDSDIRSLSGPAEILLPGIESIIIVDANLARDALVGLKEAEILSEAKYFRTLFVYNNPQSPQKENHFGFYSFSGKRHIINGTLEIGESTRELFARENMTKVVDTASFDFDKCIIKPERRFLDPDIIWHKNYPDLIPFIQMAEKLGLIIEKNSFAFTENHQYRFYLLRIKGEKFLHIVAGYPFIETKLLEAKFQLIVLNFFEIIAGKEKHLNNFFHDILGIPFLLNLIGMVKDAESHLKFAEQVKNRGMSRNDFCICGSDKKWKNCHGR